MPSLHHTVHSFRMARLRDRTRASALLKGRNADVCAGCRYLGTSGPPRQPGSTTALEPLPRYRALSFIWPPPLLAALEELATLPAPFQAFQPCCASRCSASPPLRSAGPRATARW